MNWGRKALVAINGFYLILPIPFFVSGYLVLHEYYYGRSSLLSNYANIGAKVSMSLGGIVLILAVFTLIGIYKENTYILHRCVGAITLILGLEIGACMSCYFTQNDALKLILHWLHSAQSNYLTNSNSSDTWNSIQRHVQCCGVDSYKEWYNYLSESHVPDSCCINSTVGCGRVAVASNNIYTTSCHTAVYTWAAHHQIPLIVLYILLILSQLASIIISFLSVLKNTVD